MVSSGLYVYITPNTHVFHCTCRFHGEIDDTKFCIPSFQIMLNVMTITINFIL